MKGLIARRLLFRLVDWPIIIGVPGCAGGYAHRAIRNWTPSVVAYPLRVTKDWQITAFACSITITPGTIPLGWMRGHQVSGCSWCTPFSAPTRCWYAQGFSAHGGNPGAACCGIDNQLERAATYHPAPRPSSLRNRGVN